MTATLFEAETEVESALAVTPATVAAMTGPEREDRVRQLVAESKALVSAAIERHVTGDGRELAATCILYSGGNDSTTLVHMMRDVADYAVHANTGIGIEESRKFVRRTCGEFGLPLIERASPRPEDSYREMVLRDGFPGPAWHFRMYQRLKERALSAVRSELVSNPRKERVLFIAGRRRSESARRATIPAMERRGSIVWVSPLVNWTKLDLNTYRLMERDVPANRVSDLIHMSGECLCGSFASPGERAEVDFWFPDALDLVRELEQLLAPRADIPEHRKKWGWAADPEERRRERASKSGHLCSSCETSPIPGMESL